MTVTLGESCIEIAAGALAHELAYWWGAIATRHRWRSGTQPREPQDSLVLSTLVDELAIAERYTDELVLTVRLARPARIGIEPAVVHIAGCDPVQAWADGLYVKNKSSPLPLGRLSMSDEKDKTRPPKGWSQALNSTASVRLICDSLAHRSVKSTRIDKEKVTTMTMEDYREGRRARHPDINRPDHVRGYQDTQSARLAGEAGALLPVLIGAAFLLALVLLLAWMLAALLPSMIAAFIMVVRTGRSYLRCVFFMVVATVTLLFLFYSPCSIMGSSPTSLVSGLVLATLGAVFFGWIVERRLADRGNLGIAIALVSSLFLVTTLGTLYSISTAFRYDLTRSVIHYFAPSLRDEFPSKATGESFERWFSRTYIAVGNHSSIREIVDMKRTSPVTSNDRTGLLSIEHGVMLREGQRWRGSLWCENKSLSVSLVIRQVTANRGNGTVDAILYIKRGDTKTAVETHDLHGSISFADESPIYFSRRLTPEEERAHGTPQATHRSAEAERDLKSTKTLKGTKTPKSTKTPKGTKTPKDAKMGTMAPAPAPGSSPAGVFGGDLVTLVGNVMSSSRISGTINDESCRSFDLELMQ